MKTLNTLFSKVYFGAKKVLGIKKTEAEMTIDEYIESVQNRKQQLSNIRYTVYTRNVNRYKNNDLEESGALVLA
jgi:hypothetical protein